MISMKLFNLLDDDQYFLTFFYIDKKILLTIVVKH